jgi:hypothetical protein
MSELKSEEPMLLLDLPEFTTSGTITTIKKEDREKGDSESSQGKTESKFRKSIDSSPNSSVKVTWFMSQQPSSAKEDTVISMTRDVIELTQVKAKKRRTRQLLIGIGLMLATGVTAFFIAVTPIQKNQFPRQTAYFVVGLFGYASLDYLRRSTR